VIMKSPMQSEYEVVIADAAITAAGGDPKLPPIMRIICWRGLAESDAAARIAARAAWSKQYGSLNHPLDAIVNRRSPRRS